MKKKMKKKGFTLVELLAVIVILAIIALITVPIVLKTISNSEVQAEKQSVEGYARVIEDDKANEEMLHPGQQYQIKQEEDYDYKGNKVFCQERYFDEKDKLVLNNCYVSDHKLSEEEESKKNHYNYINGKVELIKNNNQGNNDNNTNNNKTYEIGEEVTLKNEKYNVIGQGDDYVTLLKQQPLTVDEVNANKIGSDGINHVNRYTIENVGKVFNLSGYGGIAYYSSSTCGWDISGGLYYIASGCASENAASYDSSDIKYVVDNWASNNFNNGELIDIDGYEARLIKKNEIQQFYPNCDLNNDLCESAGEALSWLHSPVVYWTMSHYEGSVSMWNVGKSGGIGLSDVYAIFTVRPVINVYKSKIGS